MAALARKLWSPPAPALVGRYRPSPSFSYPSTPDVLWIPSTDVICKVSPITPTGRAYTLPEGEKKMIAKVIKEFLGCLSLSARFNSKDGESEQFKPPPKPIIIDELKQQATEKRFLSPEFIPPRGRTNNLKFFLERQFMIKRRKVINIPEFYAGSILAVSAMDPYSNGKCNTFVGICIQRSGKGLGATFVLRNVISGQGVEICYELYNPLIHEIKVLKLEKRPDENLMYLRDALPEFSTVDVNMKPVSYILYDEVPVNKMKVKMKPKPWSKRWEHPKYNIQGINFDEYLTEKDKERIKKWEMPWRQFDMMLEYDTSKIEKEIQEEVNKELNKS